MLSVTSPSFAQEDQALTELETLGLQIHINRIRCQRRGRGAARRNGRCEDTAAATTQGGLVDQASQRLADAYGRLFKAFLKHEKSVKVVTFWGINDAVSWLHDARPLLFDGDDKPKPAFQSVIDAVAGRAARGQLAPNGEANAHSETASDLPGHADRRAFCRDGQRSNACAHSR